MKSLNELPTDYMILLIVLVVLATVSMGRIIYLVVTSGKLPDFMEASEQDDTNNHL